MSTVTADDRKRVRIPDAKPGQVFSYENNADGSVTLTPIKIEEKHRFPRGSLKKYITPESNRGIREILKGCVQGAIDWPSPAHERCRGGAQLARQRGRRPVCRRF